MVPKTQVDGLEDEANMEESRGEGQKQPWIKKPDVVGNEGKERE